MSVFQAFFDEFWPEAAAERRAKVEKFYQLQMAENEIQNLTRITKPEDFFFLNVLDVKALLDSGFLRFPAMDVGSGGGVPGLLAAVLSEGTWILAESEGHKAKFLAQAAQDLGVSDRVTVFSGRGEAYLLRHPEIKTLVFRAVGTVAKVMGWFKDCSTWNKAIFFKGPSLGKEMEEYRGLSGKKVAKTSIEGTLEYKVGPEGKTRVLISLVR